jgi:hypothetical protein
MSESPERLKEVLAPLEGKRMAEWPDDVFERLGMMNPFTTGNLKQWRKALAETRHLEGAVIEAGTYRGESIAPLGWLMREDGDRRHLYGFDSFLGFPEIKPEDQSDQGYLGRSPAYFARTSQQDVQQFIDALDLSDRITLVGGFFEETLPKTDVGPISVLILDCDLYDSYKTCLVELYPKVQRGGWILFDEYFNRKYPGAKRAVDEFFAGKPEKPMRDEELFRTDPFERWYVIKQ